MYPHSRVLLLSVEAAPRSWRAGDRIAARSLHARIFGHNSLQSRESCYTDRPEACISKKWYNLFLSVDQPEGDSDAAGDAAPTPRSPAQTVAEIASSVAAEPKFSSPVSAAAGFDEIYRAAEIQSPAHGYTIMKVTEMLQSERIRTLPAEVKKNSILLALDAAGVKIEEVIEDAVKRDRALDGFERVQQKALDDLTARKAQDSAQIQAELDRLIQEHKARIQANSDEVAKEKERFYAWRLQKQQEEQKIAESVSYFVAENPITTGGAAAASRGAQPSKPEPSKSPGS